MIKSRLAIVLILILGGAELADARSVHAQVERVATTFSHESHDLPPTPGWVAEFTILSGNAVLGGIAAGVHQWIKGGSFERGFTRGVVGGGVVYTGKRVAAGEFPGAGLLGRGVAGVGGSIIRNAAEGRSPLERVVLPIGPVRLHLERNENLAARVRFDLNNLVMIGYAVGKEGLDFDFGSSVSAGAPVFKAPGRLIGTATDTTRASGSVAENVIFLSDLAWRTREEKREIFAHERIHVLQRDQMFITVADPLLDPFLSRISVLQPIYRYFDVHVTDLLFRTLAVPFSDYYDRPWELEAYHLTRR